MSARHFTMSCWEYHFLHIQDAIRSLSEFHRSLAWKKVEMYRDLNICIYTVHVSPTRRMCRQEKGFANIHQSVLHKQAEWPVGSHCHRPFHQEYKTSLADTRIFSLNCLREYCKEVKSFSSCKPQHKVHSKALSLCQHVVCHFFLPFISIFLIFSSSVSNILVWININHKKYFESTNFASEIQHVLRNWSSCNFHRRCNKVLWKNYSATHRCGKGRHLLLHQDY